VAWFMLRLLGYALLGDNREQRVVFIAGPSGSGKSKLLHIVTDVLGPLAAESDADLICVTRHGRNARTENSVRGMRMVTITETSERMNIEEGQLKRITGESVIAVNQHYAKRTMQAPVTWLIFVATNEMPSLAGFDDAIRRRMIVIPGGPGVAVPNPVIDREILAAEREGILALLAQSCAAYFRDGLKMPAQVQVTTDAYAAECDTVTQFLAECCDPAPSLNGHVPPHVMMSTAWRQYREWAGGGARLGRSAFYAALASQPGVARNDVSRRFEGITWKTHIQETSQ
jgi:putative DNA primase/helicase